MMRFGVRVAIGASIGLLLSLGLTWATGAWWMGALAGGLLGPVAFLGTFFVWSADRPDEGYEQVLFDRPNTLVGAGMLFAFVGLAFGAGLVSPLGGSGLGPEEREALATMDASRAKLADLADQYLQLGAGDPSNQSRETVAQRIADVQAARAQLTDAPVPEALAPLKVSLLKAATVIENGFHHVQRCAAGDPQACLEAKVGPMDASRGLKAYEDARAAY